MAARAGNSFQFWHTARRRRLRDSAMTGAQLVVESLISAGVKYVFGVSGDSVLAILDAMYERPEIKYITVRHEQVAAHMADGYARAGGKLAACLAQVGPGITNLITGIATAYKDSSPLIAITGNREQYKLGRDVWQEVDHEALMKPITKLTLRAATAQDVPRVMGNAF